MTCGTVDAAGRAGQDDPADRPRAAAAPVSLHAVSLLTIASLFTLYVLRPLDDNRLTSWRWTFAAEDALALLLLLSAAVLAARAGSRIESLRRPRLVLFAGAAAAAALHWSEPEVIVDAARHFTQAKHVELYGAAHFLAAWGVDIPAWTDLPLVPLVYGTLFAVFGEHHTGIQACTSLLYAGTAVITFQIGRMLWGESVGLAAGALLLGMPYLLAQVPLMLTDVPAMFLLTLALWATLAALRHGGGARTALACASIGLAFFSKYSVWLMLSVLPVAVLVESRARPEALRRGWAIAAFSILLIGAALLPVVQIIPAQLALLRDFQGPGLGRWQESFASTLLFQIHPFIAVAALASVGLAWRARDSRYAIVAWLPLLVLVLGIRRARYLVPVFPMLALMAACGLQAIRPVEVRRHAVLCVISSSLVISLFGFLPFLRETSASNLKHAGAYLDTLRAESVEVVTLPQTRVPINPAISVPLLDMHTGKRLVFAAEHLASPPAEYADSPLRFTWEQRTPAYYGGPSGNAPGIPVAVIASDAAAAHPAWLSARLAGHRLAREFTASENVFGYRTFVSVYLPAAAGE